MNRKIPWEYQKGRGLLYTVPAGIKLIIFPCFSAGVFFAGFFFIAASFPVIFLLALISGIKPWELLRGSRALLLLCFGILILKTFSLFPPGLNYEGAGEAVIISLRMIISFAAGALLFMTTTGSEIRKSLSAAESFLHLQKFKISLGITLMLGFLPGFFEIWEDIESAWKNRGGKKGPAAFIVMIPLVLNRMMEKAARTAEALEARGFR